MFSWFPNPRAINHKSQKYQLKISSCHFEQDDEEYPWVGNLKLSELTLDGCRISIVSEPSCHKYLLCLVLYNRCHTSLLDQAARSYIAQVDAMSDNTPSQCAFLDAQPLADEVKVDAAANMIAD